MLRRLTDTKGISFAVTQQSFTSYNSEGSTQNDSELRLRSAVEGYPLRRFYFRAVIGIATPLIVTLFYFFIGIYYLRAPAAEPDVPVRVGPRGAVLVNYSWFLVGTIGLGLSRYGLEGAEASMLMCEKWGSDNALQLLMHCDGNWAGLGGWLRISRKVLHLRNVTPSKLWWILAILSGTVLVALPLSGLTMELSQGYVLQEEVNPIITGRDYWTLNQRLYMKLIENVKHAWMTSSAARIPAAGIVYTEPGVDRRRFPFLQSIPTILPQDDALLDGGFGGPPNLFITAQGRTPIQGKAWGTRLRYSCATVADRSQLTIIDRHVRRENKTALYEFLKEARPENRRTDRLRLWNHGDGHSVGTKISWNKRGLNGSFIPTLLQVGISDFEGYGFALEYDEDAYEFPKLAKGTGLPQYRYYNRTGAFINVTTYNKKEHVMEIVMYQFLNDLPEKRPDLLGPSYGELSDLSNEYTIFNTTYFPTPMRMSAIGVRCTSYSEVGNATINAATSSFSDFTPTDSSYFRFYDMPATEPVTGIVPFSFGPGTALLSQKLAIEGIFESDNNALGSQSTQKPSAQQLDPVLYVRPLGAERLKPGNQTDIRYYHAFVNGEVIGSQEATVLVQGVLPWEVVAALLSFWCICSVGLTLTYGFRRRWSESLDAYSMLRFGADFAEEIRRKKDFSDTRDYETCAALKEIPGLVGDSRPQFKPGKISLIRKEEYVKVSKRKLFHA
ncbi:hypothetical protein BJ508DRAFT_204003 [Ascobolus immersus RN42]|uniref:Uncharacterized protein n=1 Tax=Ascobolus immersus RN42 TaxID=1160509 RepID=A0A3N4IQD3_ASCIM|nr:hypothetical protein BJ508DRAFT_204003 [Ascobolus immersus RN42]